VWCWNIASVDDFVLNQNAGGTQGGCDGPD
jgi:hypothetical protein